MRTIFKKIRKTVSEYFGYSGFNCHKSSSSQTTTSQASPDITGKASPMDLPREQISHSVKEVFRESELGASGQFETWTEEHSRKGATLETKRSHTKVRTGSGELVEAQQLRAKCQECGTYESELFRCDTCGIALCRQCAIETDQPGVGTTILCKKHYDELVHAEWNLWMAKDHWGDKPGNYGYKPRPPKAPKKP